MGIINNKVVATLVQGMSIKVLVVIIVLVLSLFTVVTTFLVKVMISSYTTNINDNSKIGDILFL